LHDRLTSPLYGFVFALFPLLFLGQAQSTRVSRAPNVAMASILVIVVRAFAFFVTYSAANSAVAVGLMYALPIGLIVFSLLMVLRGRQLRPPERLIAFFEAIFRGVRAIFRRRAEIVGNEA
jgi:lipopolysaccharide export system permease protein